MRVGWIPGEYTFSDLLKKTTMARNMRHGIVETILYNKAVVIREKDKRRVEAVESKRKSPRLKHELVPPALSMIAFKADQFELVFGCWYHINVRYTSIDLHGLATYILEV